MGKDNEKSERYRFADEAAVFLAPAANRIIAESVALPFSAFTIYEFLRHSSDDGEEETRTIVDVGSRKALPSYATT